MKNVKLCIDGQGIIAKEGMTILEAAEQARIKIPTLCAMPELGFTPGSCRVCVVEVEGTPTLSAACMTYVIEGMIIHTNSERVIKARRIVVELLISNHPLDCMTCEKNGNCNLENLAYDLDIKESRFEQNKKEITYR